MRNRYAFVCCVLVLGLSLVEPARLPEEVGSLSDPPHLWQIVWADDVSIDRLRSLKAAGFDGLFKCVAYAPNYPAGPIHAGAEWRLVERDEGEYDWSSLEQCLDNALEANMWFIPEIVINVPPDWFLQQYPGCLLEDSRGITSTDPYSEGAPYLLSPWFVQTSAADAYLQPLIDSFISLVSEYPNVPAIMIGNFKLNVLPWKMGTDSGDNFTYWPIWDEYARASYASQFGTGALPPATWSDYVALGTGDRAAFREWLTSAMRDNLENRYLPWVSGFAGWKVVNASIWDADGVRASVFTTGTPEMTAAKQEAIASSDVERIVINDDNMGDAGLEQLQQQDVELAHSNGFLIYGERVPDVGTWAQLVEMWQGFDPLPDGFINIGAVDDYWVGELRTLYGAPTEPLPVRAFLPIILVGIDN